MERIEPSDRSKSFRARKRKNTPENERAEHATFTDALSDVSSTRVEKGSNTEFSSGSGGNRRSVGELLDEIYGIGEKLKKNPDHGSVMTYKRAVQELVRIAVDHGIRVEEQTSSPNILRQKRFTLVRVIDEKLDRLVSEVLMSQRETLDILGKVDEINGLLVDLTS